MKRNRIKTIKFMIVLMLIFIMEHTNANCCKSEINFYNVKESINSVNVSDCEDEVDIYNNVLNDINNWSVKDSYDSISKMLLYGNIDGKNVLTQDMIDKTNTRYLILYDYDLNGKEIIIPEGCVLDFQGGSLRNGKIIGNNSVITSKKLPIFGEHISFAGSWNNDVVYSEWFEESYTDFYVLCTLLTTIVREFGSIIVERDTYMFADSPAIPILKGMNFDFKNKKLTLEKRTSIASDGDIKYVFISNKQDGVLKNLKFANLNINASANIKQTGKFSGLTSGWAFCYITNINGCVIENVNFSHAAVGFKFGYLDGSDLGRKNIIISRCYLVGKMLIQLFSSNDIVIEKCYFDQKDATNEYDHSVYTADNRNVVLKDCVYKNSLSALNLWNADSIIKAKDQENIKIVNSKLINVASFLHINNAYNILIDSVFFEKNVKNILLLNIWNSRNINVNNVLCEDYNVYIRNTIKGCSGVELSNLNLQIKAFNLGIINSTFTQLNNSVIKIKGFVDNNRLISTRNKSNFHLSNSIIDFTDSQGSEKFFNDNKSDNVFVVENCKILAKGDSRNKLLFRYPCIHKNTIIKNTYVELMLFSTITVNSPQIINCYGVNGKFIDIP